MLAVCSQEWSRHQCISQACQGLHASYTPTNTCLTHFAIKKVSLQTFISYELVYIYKTWQAARSESIVGRLLNPTTYQDLMKQAVKMCQVCGKCYATYWHRFSVPAECNISLWCRCSINIYQFFLLEANWPWLRFRKLMRVYVFLLKVIYFNTYIW